MADEIDIRETTKAPLILAREDKCTAYLRGAFGYRRTELRSVDVQVRPYAQHAAAVHVTWIEKGKRSRMGATLTDRDGVGLVILLGHGHPEVADPMTPKEKAAGGVVVSQMRWTCYAPEWSEEFARQFDPYLVANPEIVLADYRKHDVSGGARLAELRNGVALTAGDRVVTHKGPGLIVMVRRDEAGRAEQFRVKLDRPQHSHVSGQVEGLWWVLASECRWEGAATAAQVAR